VSNTPVNRFDPNGLKSVGEILQDAKKAAESMWDGWGLFSAKQDADKTACLCRAIANRKQGWEELTAKLGRREPMSDFDNEALRYLEVQRKKDMITAYKIGMDYTSAIYSSMGTMGFGASTSIAEMLTRSGGGSPASYGVHQPGRGPWTVWMTNECED
jgi:hypothetical protein